MNKLLHAGIRRYAKSKVFWIGLAVFLILGGYIGKYARRSHLNMEYVLVVFVLLTVLFTWLVGREHEEGSFRNKIIAGHKKGTIFLSEILVGAVVCSLLFLVCAIGFSWYTRYMFGIVPMNVLVRIFFSVLLVNIGISSICITFGCFFSHRVLSFIVSMVVIFGIYQGTEYIESALIAEEYTDVDEIVENVDAEGNKTLEIVTTGRVKNPLYVSGAKRTAYEILYKVSPWRNLNDATSVVGANFGYDNFLDELERNEILGWELDYGPGDARYFSMTDEEDNMLSELWRYSVAFLLVVTSIGYGLFCRKEFQ